MEILRALLRTERRLDRRRVDGARWGPRSIDLDLLWDERGAFEAAGLQVPHRELRNRDFALAPFLDVAPEQAALFGASLAELGGAPLVWSRTADRKVDASSTALEIEVESDSLADACALCAAALPSVGRAWSSRHMRIEAGPEAFASAVRTALRSGFAIHFATVSHCSEAQWDLQFHGVNDGLARDSDVRLVTTLGSKRAFRARMSAELTLR